LKDLQQEIGAPAGSFASCLDAPLGLIGTHEAEREAADEGHVLGSVAGPITRQIVLEFDIEQPMHALDAPVPARTPGDAFDIERRGRDIVVGIEAAAIGIFGAGVNLRDGIDVLEARLARVASLRRYPVDLAGGGVSARLDPAMSLLDGGFADKFVGGRGAEIVLDIFCGALIISQLKISDLDILKSHSRPIGNPLIP
jgi:hypothetical protein